MFMFICHEHKIDLIGIWRYGVYPYLGRPLPGMPMIPVGFHLIVND